MVCHILSLAADIKMGILTKSLVRFFCPTRILKAENHSFLTVYGMCMVHFFTSESTLRIGVLIVFRLTPGITYFALCFCTTKLVLRLPDFIGIY